MEGRNKKIQWQRMDSGQCRMGAVGDLWERPWSCSGLKIIVVMMIAHMLHSHQENETRKSGYKVTASQTMLRLLKGCIWTLKHRFASKKLGCWHLGENKFAFSSEIGTKAKAVVPRGYVLFVSTLVFLSNPYPLLIKFVMRWQHDSHHKDFQFYIC